MTRPSVFAAVAFILVGWLSGCAGLGRPLESPRISLANIQMLETSGMESAFLVQLRVQNPNEVNLDIRGVECDLEINGKPFAYGLSSTPVMIPAFGSDTVPVKVYTSMIDIFRGLLSLQGREDLSYQVKGKVRMSGEVVVAIESNGMIRDDLLRGKTGNVAVCDLFRTAPLGFSRGDDTMGYPLITCYFYGHEIK